MDTIKQLKWRYATKKFDASKKLSVAKLNVVKQAFNLTATSFGLQTIKLLVIEDVTIREALVPHSYFQKQVLEASHLLVICIQKDVIQKDVEAYYNNIQDIRQTPNDILNPYKEDLIKNPGMRALMKIQLNSLWGKFGQRNDLEASEYFTSENIGNFWRKMRDHENKSINITNVKVIDCETKYITYKNLKEENTSLPTT